MTISSMEDIFGLDGLDAGCYYVSTTVRWLSLTGQLFSIFF
jgi:hypothetical protein